MIITKEVFKENSFNTELTYQFFAVVLFKKYHLGINFNTDNITIIVQRPNVTTFYTLGNKTYIARMKKLR